MMRDGRAGTPAVVNSGLRLKGLAALTASLLLGACSQSADLLSGAGLTTADTTSAKLAEDAAPQSELQRATLYWGQENAKRPAELEPALNFARNLKAMGEKQKALSVLQQASVFHGDNTELAGEYGRLALELDQVSVADRLLAAADDPTKPDWRIISARGTVQAKQGKYSEAIPYYERALQLSANQPSVLNNLAMAHAMLGEAGKAEGILRSASSQANATRKVRENLALVLELQGRHGEAQQIAAAAQGPVAVAGPPLSEPQTASPTQPRQVADTSAAAARLAFKPATMESHVPGSAGGVWQTDVAEAVPAPR